MLLYVYFKKKMTKKKKMGSQATAVMNQAQVAHNFVKKMILLN